MSSNSNSSDPSDEDVRAPSDETASAKSNGVRAWPVVGVVFAVLWLFVRGVALAPAAIVGQFLFGLAVGLPIAYLFRRLYADRVDLGRVARSLPATGLYVATFGWELVRANVDVAYRVLAPNMPIEPEVILIPLRVESDAAVTLLANSITITPGTVTLDYAEDVNALYVHVVDGRDPDAIVAPIRRWEDYALEMFDEDRSPDDPAPGFVVSGGDRARRRADEDRRGFEDESESEDEDAAERAIDTRTEGGGGERGRESGTGRERESGTGSGRGGDGRDDD